MYRSTSQNIALRTAFCLALIALLIWLNNGPRVAASRPAFTATALQPPALANIFPAPGGKAGDNFGVAVAISGDYAVVGADGVDGSGAAYVYKLNGAAWQFQQQLVAADRANGDKFGFSAGCFGNLVVVGAPGKTISGQANRGAVYFFVRTGDRWQEVQRITAEDGWAESQFGYSVDINLLTIAVGAPFDNRGSAANPVRAGAVYVYAPNEGVWLQQQKINSADSRANDQFGSAVSVSVNRLAIGAPREAAGGNSEQGTVYVFNRTGTTWAQSQKLNAVDGGAGDNFGAAVSLNGFDLAIGAPLADPGGLDASGAAYVYTFFNDNVWRLQQRVTPGDAHANALFGWAVSISNEKLLAGAPAATGATVQNRPGAAYLFARAGGNWRQQQRYTKNTVSDGFGFAVSLKGNAVLAGAPGEGFDFPAGTAAKVARGTVPQTEAPLQKGRGGAAINGDAFSTCNASFTAAATTNATTPATAARLAPQQIMMGTARIGANTVIDAAAGLAPQLVVINILSLRLSSSGNLEVRGKVVTKADPSAGIAKAPVKLWVFEAATTELEVSGTQVTDEQGDFSFSFPFACLTGKSEAVGFLFDSEATTEAFAGTNLLFFTGFRVPTPPAPPPPCMTTISINDLALPEGNPSGFSITANSLAPQVVFGFTVSLSQSCNQTVSVQFKTVEGSAKEGSDYVGKSGTLIFAPGQTSELITIQGILDDKPECDETFTVQLSNPVNAMLAKSVGEGKLINDDIPQFSISNATVVEGEKIPNKIAVFEITLSPPSDCETEVDYATLSEGTALPGQDYVRDSGTLVFPPGTAKIKKAIEIIGDSREEAFDEFFELGLLFPVNATIAKRFGTGTIVDDDGANKALAKKVQEAFIDQQNALARASATARLQTNSAVFTVSLKAPATTLIEAAYNTADGSATAGSDYTARSGTLVFNPGEQSKTIEVPILNDAAPEANEDFSITLSSPVEISLENPLFAVILNDDACPGFTVAPASAAFNSNAATGSISINAGGNCGWSAESNVPWLTFPANTLDFGDGNAKLAYLVAANDTAQPRTGVITINGQAHTVTQQALCPALTLNPASLPNGTLGAAYNQLLAAGGGTAPLSFSLNAGTLPPGLTFSTAGALGGTPMQLGTFSFSLRATDANGCAGTREYTLAIVCPIVTLTPAVLPAGRVGAAYTQTLAATGGGTLSFALSAGALPPGLSLSATGLLSGTPTTAGTFNFTVRATSSTTCSGAQAYTLVIAALPTIACVSAASFSAENFAPNMIVAAFGTGFSTATQVATTQPLPTVLAGVSVSLTDSAGVARLAQLFFVSAQQLNFLLPGALSRGRATVTVRNGTELIAAGTVQINDVAPGLFTANADGRGVPAAIAVKLRANGEQVFLPVAQFDAQQQRFVPVPLESGAGERVFLVLFGTGWRLRSALEGVTAKLGGEAAPVLFAGAQGQLDGLDQLNLEISAALAGRGLVDVELSVDGQSANVVQIQIK